MVVAMLADATWWHVMVVGLFIALDLRRRREHVAHHTPADDAYRAGYDYGYDEGWHAGRREARPTVVPLRPTGTEYHTGEIR